MAKDNSIYWIIGIIALIAIFIIGPQTGLFAVITLSNESLAEIEDCPEYTLTPSPCDGAVWVDKPYCSWDMSECKDYCESDAECRKVVAVPNDCSLFWEPSNVTIHGMCSYNFCQWQEAEPVALRQCTWFETFLQKYFWVLVTVGVVAIAYFLAEKDMFGKKRGFF